MRWADLENRRVAIIGFGREGRAAYRQLRRRFPRAAIGIFDENEKLVAPDQHCNMHLGPFDQRQLSRYEIALRSPGVSPYRDEIAAALQQGLEILSPGSLWFGEHPEARTICITGTKGKSTTAALTAHLLRSQGQAVVLAGNIGRPLLDCDEEQVDWWVIEQSSYQLADLKGEPTIGAILNISDEHLDWHRGRANYRKDKLRLAELVSDRPLVLNWNDQNLRALDRDGVAWFGHPEGWHVRDHALWRGGNRLVGPGQSTLAGDHNLVNLAAALTLLECTGLPINDPVAALQGFEALPHRLQLLGIHGGVRYVNDSLSTTPVSTLAALQAYSDAGVILLLGGFDRGLDWTEAAKEMAGCAPIAVLCMPDNGPQIAAALEAAGFSPKLGIHCVADLEQAVRTANKLAAAGDVVLLSPGAPSFPHFRDYAERGERFARLAEIVRDRGTG